MTDQITLQVVQWAAQECEWQLSGELSVAWMVEAWQYALKHRAQNIALNDVLVLGALVEPRVNFNGIRRVNVQVGGNIKLDHQLVPAALDQLLTAQDLVPVEWFRQYEDIHPFRDGNGRTGNILYNWLLGTLDEPVFPPNLWHDPYRGDNFA